MAYAYKKSLNDKLMSMKIIELEPHFWELYQESEQLYLAIAIDVSSVVSCWDLALTQIEIEDYQNFGRNSIDQLAKKLVKEVFRGNFSNLENRPASAAEKQAMQVTFKSWRDSQK